MSLEDVAALSPEFNATVNLTVMALRQDMAYVESLPHVESTMIGSFNDSLSLAGNGSNGLNNKGKSIPMAASSRS
ncbi:hypothetical protein AB6F62_08035 [Providencia huaxiensis]|uniref:hypothetical protein n=1 Tax=Providencia huaxiensis TaxID=2027290 RepID=UPI0034DD28F4